MAKRLSVKAKEEILNFFIKGDWSIEKLSSTYDCTKTTIIRNLKKELGNKKYQEIIDSRSSKEKSKDLNKDLKSEPNQKDDLPVIEPEKEFDFVELAPLDFEIENSTRKEYSSVPIQEIQFPKVVYMVVSKNIELEIKLLRDYANWEFLPDEDLKRKTIEIFLDLKSARRVCNKEQKVIKVPNAEVFKITSPILVSRGITRIVNDDKLISL